MQLIVTNIKSGEIMFAALHNASKEDIKKLVRFYATFKEYGVRKYRIKAAKV
jgi:hypothetical protein